MKSRYILAGAGLLHSVRAIPAYITTVFSCPDVVTITQTVYPPGWTNTGPIYTTRPLTEPRPEPEGNRPPQAQCTEQGLTTSWETEYATRTMYYSEYGMYSGPPGCPPTIYAYMPTTVTCSEPQTTGWVGYSADIACVSCTATTLVGLKPGVSTVNGAVVTYYTIFTEVYVEAGATTQANMIGSQWTTSGTPPYVAPYAQQCTNTAGGNGGGATPTVGGGLTVTAAGTGRPYPSIDYNDPNVFNGGQSVPIVSNGYTANNKPAPNPSPAANGNNEPAPSQSGPYTWTRGGGYPSINYDDPNVFRGGPGTGAPSPAPNTSRPPSAETAGPETSRPVQPPSGTGRPTSYPGDFTDPNVFRPLTSRVEIVSATGPPPILTPATTTYTVPSSFGANYNSVDFEATENFRPLTGISIVSLNPPQSFPAPITTSIPVTSRVTSNYPSIDYANPSIFRGIDPNDGGAAPASTATSPVTSATSAA
ncbi:uncharacterized protein DFL_001627 [Arthrobotrys flagrans]|uniref:Uncharacterized protein n=1 Tax=Arthrobotrys flagrans TaxID=97331 RepID=A0A437A8H3_ARTFL|nr:hypothetical protein DFL_001627 [Arthrobotrys flagrans]